MITVTTVGFGDSILVDKRARIVSAAHENGNAMLLRPAGANATAMPPQAGGYLLADAVTNSYVIDYVFDLLTSDARVAPVECGPLPDALGKSMRDIDRGVAARLCRNGEQVQHR